ncbi:UNVERIFIED_CONTAM: hypothetical protein Scaly_1032200 [Sesamum calycinum]|uniref:DUF4283 domain-containing protein n=1 Tax=Sesamum calycinum TaxID=2727403 RepID=A0AAW2QJX6_9LAMI
MLSLTSQQRAAPTENRPTSAPPPKPLLPQQPPKSFAETLKTHLDSPKSKPQNTDLQKSFLAGSKPVPVGTQTNIDGRLTLIFSDTETLSLAAGYRFALIGEFSQGTPKYRNLHHLIAGLGVLGGFTVSMINPKHVLISLTNEMDFSQLWLRRIWYIKGYPMRVFKWSPTFTPAQESSIVPIWVCFPELPAHLFHKDALFAVASMIGTQLQIDDFTFNQSKLSKARVGIEIEITNPLVEEFDLQVNGVTIRQKVEYEQVPKFCGLCKHVGHHDQECYLSGNTPRPTPHIRKQDVKGKKTVIADACLTFDEMPNMNIDPARAEKGECWQSVSADRYTTDQIDNSSQCAVATDTDSCRNVGENVGVGVVNAKNHFVVHTTRIENNSGNEACNNVTNTTYGGSHANIVEKQPDVASDLEKVKDLTYLEAEKDVELSVVHEKETENMRLDSTVNAEIIGKDVSKDVNVEAEVEVEPVHLGLHGDWAIAAANWAWTGGFSLG